WQRRIRRRRMCWRCSSGAQTPSLGAQRRREPRMAPFLAFQGNALVATATAATAAAVAAAAAATAAAAAATAVAAAATAAAATVAAVATAAAATTGTVFL